MKFLALIPARYASTRFPGKPLAMIHGKSMIERVYNRVSSIFDYCYVATDDRRIADHVLSFGGRVIMTSTDHRSGTDRCAEALLAAEEEVGFQFDAIVNVQGDEPFIAPEQLTQIKKLLQRSETQIATLVKPFAPHEDIFNANSPKVVLSTDGRAIYFSRSVIPYLRSTEPSAWQSSHQYYKHIGLYGYRRDILLHITKLSPSPLETAESLEQLRWLENNLQIHTDITHIESHAIDTPADLETVLQLFPTL